MRQREAAGSPTAPHRNRSMHEPPRTPDGAVKTRSLIMRLARKALELAMR